MDVFKILIRSIAVLVICWHSETSAQLTFDESGYKSVMERAKAEKKPVFLMFYATWCPHCTKMKKEVFTNPQIAAELSSKYICAAQDIDKPEARPLMQQYHVKSLPSFAFIAQDGTLLYSIAGEMNVVQMNTEITEAGTEQKQLPYLRNAFMSDQSNADKCIAYLTALKKGHDRKFLSAPAHLYLATQNEEDLTSLTNWRVISNAVTDIESREFQYLLKHREKFEKSTSPSRVENKLMSVTGELLSPFIEARDTISYYKRRASAVKINTRKTDSLIFVFDLSIAERTGGWKKYHETVSASAEKFIWSNESKLKEVAQNYVTHISSPGELKTGILIAERALTLKESNDGLLATAKLYAKAGDKRNASVYANRAKVFAESMGWESKEADAILLSLKNK